MVNQKQVLSFSQIPTNPSRQTARSPIIAREIQPIAENKLRSLLYDPTIFSSYERNYCQYKPTPLFSIAGLWCVKLAFTRLTTESLKFFNFNFLDLEIRHHHGGQPTILLHGKLANWYRQQNIAIEVAISHQKTLVAAVVLCHFRL